MAEHAPSAGSDRALLRHAWSAMHDSTTSGRWQSGVSAGLALGLGLAILAAVASAALMGLAGWLIVKSAQTGLSTTSTFSWIYPSAGVEALAVVRTAARYGERLTTHGATLQMLARLRARMFASATRMSPRLLRRFHSGDLLDRVQADIDSLDRVVLAVAVPAVVGVVVGAAGIAVLTAVRPVFGLIGAFALAAALLGDFAVGRRSRPAGTRLAQARSAARTRLVEVLDGRMELAAYSAGPLAAEELRAAFQATDAPRRRWSAREASGLLITDLAGVAALAAVLAAGAGLAGPALPPAVLAFAALLILTLFEIAAALAAAGPARGEALAAWRRLTETSGLGQTRDAPAHAAADLNGAWPYGGIEIRGLLAGMGDHPALRIERLDLPAGGLIVVTGVSGAGKSTLLRTLAGELAPMAGVVRIGGADAHAIPYEQRVAYVTLVEQDSRLLSGTIEDNLRLANPAAETAELREALRIAALDDAVTLSTRLGPGGEGLSGGQRRRLALAQAYLRHPSLLLLDEPTEGLDIRTARIVLQNLRTALPETTLVAAIHDRTLDHLPLPADLTIGLAAGRVASAS